MTGDALRGNDEWWLSDLSRELGIPQPTVHSWIRRGWIRGRKLPGMGGRWILWADAEELDRLRRLRLSADLAGRDVPDGVDDPEMRPDPETIGPSTGRGGCAEGPIQGVTKEALWLVQRTRYTFDQVDDADGRSAVQDARDGAQGDLGSPAGVQPAPHGDGGGRGENGIEPRQVSFKGAKQAVTAFAPKIEAARPKDRPGLIDAMLTVIAYHRVGNRPGRWEPRATKRRPRHGARLNQTRAEAKLPENRRKWF